MSMTLNEIKAKRQILVDEVMCKVTKIEENYGITRDSVNLMKNEVASLAKYPELFITSEFQPAKRGTFKDFVAYRLNKEDGTDRALYVSLALPGKTSPPHNHNNWAILIGLDGVEINKLYKADETGFKQIDEVPVGPGVAIALMGEDIHSIHVQGKGDEPVWQIRFYERALELQTDRQQFDENGNTEIFEPNANTKNAVN
jgi:hypothetical protein